MRGAFSLTPRLQPGDEKPKILINRFNGFTGKPLKRFVSLKSADGHRAEAGVLMRTLRVIVIQRR